MLSKVYIYEAKMIKMIRWKVSFTMFFILCCLVLMLLVPMKKETAKADLDHFIYLETGFDGTVYIKDGSGCVAYILDRHNTGLAYSLPYECSEIIIEPFRTDYQIKFGQGQYQQITQDTYQNYAHFYFPAQIYIRKEMPAEPPSPPPVKYTVTFQTEDGEVILEEEYEENTSAVAPAAPLKEGKNFIGWNSYDFENVTKNMTIIAMYETVRYDVIFTIDNICITESVEHNAIINLENFSWYPVANKELHEFKHFYIEGGDVNAAFDFSSTHIVGNIILNAYYERSHFLVTYNVGNINISERIKKGNLATEFIPDLDSGYFLGWFYGDQIFDFSQPINEDISLDAYIADEICTITYMVKTDIAYIYKVVIIEKNSKLEDNIIPPSRPDDQFISWQKRDSNNIAYDFDDIVNEDLQLFAIYSSDLITVTVDLDGGDSPQPYSALQIIRDGFEPVLPIEVNKDGHVFIGWDISQNENNRIYFAKYERDLVITYYLAYLGEVYRKVYEISVVYNSVIESFVTVDQFDEAKKNDIEYNGIMLDEGWEFLYWRLADIDVEYTNKVITEDLELYAKIAIKKHPVYLLYEEEQIVLEVEHSQKIKAFDIPIAEEGYYYIWHKDSVDGAVFDFEGSIKSPIWIYAQKMRVYIQVDFNLSIKEENLSYSEEIEYGNSAKIPTIEKEGYTILWYADWEYNNLYCFSESLFTDTVIYGLVTPNQYTITIELFNEYKIENKVYQFLYDEDIALHLLDEYGYIHNGEYFDINNQVFILSKMPARNITLYAHLEKVIFTVTFADIDIEREEQYEYLTVIALNGQDTATHKFHCWQDEEGKQYQNFYTIKSNVKLTAVYTEKNIYTVTFIKGESGEEIKIKVIENCPVEPLIQHELEGYDFLNWYINSDLTELFDFEFLITEDIFIYGKYNKKSYTITFIADDNILCFIDVLHGEKLENVNSIDYEVFGYEFLGWYKDTSFLEPFNVDDEVITKEFAVYAKYKVKLFEVTFIGLNNAVLKTVFVEYNKNISDIDDLDADVEGHVFLGWFADSSYNTSFDFSSYKAVSDCYIYAGYMIKSYIINVYDINKKLYTTHHIDYGERLDISKISVYNVTGYEFLGWYCDAELTKPFEDKEVKESFNLYAKYRLKRYTVVFKGLNGAIIFTSNIDHGQNAPQPDEELFSVEGYVFEGFNKQLSIIIKDEVFSAVYIPIKYVDEYGNVLENSFAPLKEGYEFLGWEEVRTEDAIKFVPVYQQLTNTSSPQKFDILNGVFLEIMLRLFIIAALLIFLAFAKGKRKTKNL